MLKKLCKSEDPWQDDVAANETEERSGGAAASQDVSFAAAWVTHALASGNVTLEHLIATACSEGGSGADATALREAARQAVEAARGDAAAALAFLVAGQQHLQQAVAPVQPHDGWLCGPPKPACHEERARTADAINSMRATRDGEIGA